MRMIFLFPLSSIQPMNGRNTTAMIEKSAAANPATASEPPRYSI